jgi:hypothetical protein
MWINSLRYRESPATGGNAGAVARKTRAAAPAEKDELFPKDVKAVCEGSETVVLCKFIWLYLLALWVLA